MKKKEMVGRQQINTRKIVSRLHHSLTYSYVVSLSVSQFLFVSYIRRLTLKSILIGFLFKKGTFFLHHTIIICCGSNAQFEGV